MLLRISFIAFGTLVLSVAAQAQVNLKDYRNRNNQICEKDLLDRRIAESRGLSRSTLEAVKTNAVSLIEKNGWGYCSGIYITPTCVMTSAHCFENDVQPEVIVRQTQTDKFHVEGTGYRFPGYEARRKDRAGWAEGGDTGLIVFPFKNPHVRPIRVHYFKGIRDFLIYGLDMTDDEFLEKFKTDQYLNSQSWADYGVLGSTGMAPSFIFEFPDSPIDSVFRQQCSDSHFGWFPQLANASGKGIESFAPRRLAHSSLSGPGFSGGAIYDETGILGTHSTGVNSDWSGVEDLGESGWSLIEDDQHSPSKSGGWTPIDLPMAEFIHEHCPGVQLQQRFGRRGEPVANLDALSPNGFLGEARDPWQDIRYGRRHWYVPFGLRKGDEGLFVERLQKSLKGKGVYTGPIDGIFDEGVRSRVQKYQRRNGLPVSGEADVFTLDHLNILLPRQ